MTKFNPVSSADSPQVLGKHLISHAEGLKAFKYRLIHCRIADAL